MYSKKEYTGDFLNENLNLKNVEDGDIRLFKDVIESAKKYFIDKENFENNIDDALNGNN